MSRKQIIIDVDENGNCSIEGKGFKGPECEKFIEEISSAIGKTTDVKNTDEHSQRERGRAVNRQRNRQ